jgi:hypothetical protein
VVIVLYGQSFSAVVCNPHISQQSAAASDALQ